MKLIIWIHLTKGRSGEVIKKLFIIFVSLVIQNVTNGQTVAQVPDIELLNIVGDTIKLSDYFEKDKRTLVLYFASWCKPSVVEFDYLYEEGVIDLCNTANVTKILITCEKSLPNILLHYPEKSNNSLLHLAKMEWPKRLLDDFMLLYENNYHSSKSFVNTIGNGSFPLGCIIEPDSTISYSFRGLNEESLKELKARILHPKDIIPCYHCNGTGNNPKVCVVCKGTGRCRACYYDIDYFLHHCSACNDSRICFVCKAAKDKMKVCPVCKGNKTKIKII